MDALLIRGELGRQYEPRGSCNLPIWIATAIVPSGKKGKLYAEFLFTSRKETADRGRYWQAFQAR